MPNIPRSKCNQKNETWSVYTTYEKIFFLKNHAQNVSEKLVPDTFLKKSKLSISLDQQFKAL